MARPKKTVTKKEEIKEVKEVTKEKDTMSNEKFDKIDKENQDLKSQLEEMRLMMESLSKTVAMQGTVNKQDLKARQDEDEVLDIPLNKVIKVMSLYEGGLNLKTGENGKSFRFNNFGDIQPIIYGDLVQIINHQHRFCTDGYFMILDSKVVKAHALEGNYKKLLNDKQIREILEYEDEKITQLFTSTTRNIRETIVTHITKKIKANEHVDKNKVDLLSKLYGVNLFSFANEDFEVLVNNKPKE